MVFVMAFSAPYTVAKIFIFTALTDAVSSPEQRDHCFGVASTNLTHQVIVIVNSVTLFFYHKLAEPLVQILH